MAAQVSLRSATFALDLSDVDSYAEILRQVTALHSSRALTDFTVQGGAAERERIKVVGTEDGIEAVAALLEGRPLVLATHICDWCLNFEAANVVTDAVEEPEVTVGICHACEEAGIQERLIRRRRMVARGDRQPAQRSAILMATDEDVIAVARRRATLQYGRVLTPGVVQREGLSFWLPVAGGVAVTFPRFLLDSTDSIQRMSVPWAVAMTAWWCLPLLWLLKTARSGARAWAVSATYIAAAGFSLAATYRNTHSTAGFGIMFVPVYLAAGVGVVLGVEALMSRHGGHER